jgi:cobalt/nickel transport system permease protein
VSHADLAAHIDRHAYTNALAKKSPTTKILFAFSTLLLGVLSPSPVVPIIVFTASAFLILGFAKIPARFYLELLLYPTIIAAISCVIIALFFGYGEPLAELALPWFKWTIFKSGISTAVATFFRVESGMSATYFLVLTTSMTDILITLRKAHIPKTLVEMSLLIYRYIFVFIEVTAKMQTAQKLRLGSSGLMKRIRATALLAGNLFIRTLEQGERTFTAMSARGYDGNIRVLEDLPQPRITWLAAIMLFDAVLILTALTTMNVGVV